jgi:hypothetical protein
MITDSQAPRWLTMAQYAKAMGLSLSSVKRMKLTGAIPFRQVGRIVRPRHPTGHGSNDGGHEHPDPSDGQTTAQFFRRHPHAGVGELKTPDDDHSGLEGS